MPYKFEQDGDTAAGVNDDDNRLTSLLLSRSCSLFVFRKSVLLLHLQRLELNS